MTARTTLEGTGLAAVGPGQPIAGDQHESVVRRPAFTTRAAAFVVDLLLAATAVYLLSALIGTYVYAPRATPGQLQPVLALEILLAALVATLPTLWAVAAWRGARRATPGQRLYRLQVIDAPSGQRLSAVAAVSRWLLLYAPVALMVGYPTIISTAVPSQVPLVDLYELPWLAVALTALPLLWYGALAYPAVINRPAGVAMHDRLCRSTVVQAQHDDAPEAHRTGGLRHPLLWLSVVGALLIAGERAAAILGQLWNGWDLLPPVAFTIADTVTVLLPAALLWRVAQAGRRHPLLLLGLAIGAALSTAPLLSAWLGRAGPDLAAFLQMAPLTWLQVLAPILVGMGLLAIRRSGPTRPILLIAIAAAVMIGAAVPPLVNSGGDLLLSDIGLLALYAGATGFLLWVPAAAWLDGERPRPFWGLLALALPLQLTALLGSALLFGLTPTDRLPELQPWLLLVGGLTALLAAALAFVAYGAFTPRATTPHAGSDESAF